jgi:hypothetical protein
VVATNQGDAAVTNVKINDATPPFTSYKNGGNCTTNLGAPTPATAFAPTGAGITGGVGSINCDKWTTIPAAAEVQLDFAVRIDP